MENKVINLEFDSMNDEEMELIIQKAQEYKRKSLDKRVAELENWRKQAKSEIEVLRKDKVSLTEKVKELEDVIEVTKEETNQITKTLFTHGTQKRELENHIHRLVYKEIGEDSLRDELFHGCLTASCKKHINKSLNVSQFNWIEVKDLNVAKRLSSKFLDSVTIHSLMQKSATDLFEKMNNSKKDNSKSNGKNARRYELLEKLLEEVGGNIYAI
jgi:chromosome segregation ATPase